MDGEVAWVESAARWLEFHMERFRVLWWRDTLLDEDPLVSSPLDTEPTLEDLSRAVTLLLEDVVELEDLLRRVQRSAECLHQTSVLGGGSAQ